MMLLSILGMNWGFRLNADETAILPTFEPPDVTVRQKRKGEGRRIRLFPVEKMAAFVRRLPLLSASRG